MGKTGFTALKNINLRVERGEFIAIMGHSGSSKSTLMNIIAAWINRVRTNIYSKGKDDYE